MIGLINSYKVLNLIYETIISIKSYQILQVLGINAYKRNGVFHMKLDSLFRIIVQKHESEILK